MASISCWCTSAICALASPGTLRQLHHAGVVFSCGDLQVLRYVRAEGVIGRRCLIDGPLNGSHRPRQVPHDHAPPQVIHRIDVAIQRVAGQAHLLRYRPCREGLRATDAQKLLSGFHDGGHRLFAMQFPGVHVFSVSTCI